MISLGEQKSGDATPSGYYGEHAGKSQASGKNSDAQILPLVMVKLENQS